MSPPTLSFLNLPLEPTLTRLILDRLPLDVYLCTHLISFPIPRPLWRQEEPVCPTAYVTMVTAHLLRVLLDEWGGRGRQDSRCRRDSNEKSPDTQLNSLTRSQAATLQPVSSKEKLWSADLQPCSEDPKPIHWDCPYQCLTPKLQTVSCQNLLPRPSSEAEPLITHSLLQASLLIPFLPSRRRHQGGARWDSPSGQGREGPVTGSRKPEGELWGRVSWKPERDPAGPATWSRCTSKRTSEGRGGHGLGRSQAGRALVPWAGASVVCQNGGPSPSVRALPWDQLGRAQSLAVMRPGLRRPAGRPGAGDIGPDTSRDLQGRD